MTWVREQVDALRELLLPNCSRRVDPSLSHAHRLDLSPFLALISVERGGLEYVLELQLELERLVSLTDDAIQGDLASCEALDADGDDVFSLSASAASPSTSSSTGPHTALPRPAAPVARHPSLLLLRMQVLMLGARFESQHGSDPTCFTRAESFLHRALEEFPGEIDVYKELGGLLLSSRNDGGKAAEEIYSRALLIAPDDAEVHYNIGRVHSELRHAVKDALPHALTALKLAPLSASFQHFVAELTASP